MKTIKTLLAASVLAAAGAAHAATIDTYTVSITGTTTGLATGSLSGSGTATLDDSGSLTINYSALNTQPSAGGNFNTTTTTIFTGTISGSSFTATGGTSTVTSCSPGTTVCPSALPLNTPSTLSATPATAKNGGGLLEQAFAIAGSGSNTSTVKSYNGLLVNKLTYTFSAATPVSSVPVPAAAWLFGSGLIGLAGTARRRRSA